MRWDDELETLAEQVRKAFGEMAVSEAYVRALTSAPPIAPDVVGPLAELFDGLGAQATKFVDGATSAALLKAELRRMLTAH